MSYSDYQYKSIYETCIDFFTDLPQLNEILYTWNVNSGIVDLYWKYMLKLYRELTYNKCNRIDIDQRNPYKWGIYLATCRCILPFIEHSFANGMNTGNSNRLTNDCFNLCLQTCTNLVSSRFIDTRTMENMRDPHISQLLHSICLIISTVPVENLHVSHC